MKNDKVEKFMEASPVNNENDIQSNWLMLNKVSTGSVPFDK